MACYVGNVLYNLVDSLMNGLAFDCFPGSSFKCIRIGRIKIYTPTWYYYVKLYRLFKEDKVSDKWEIDTILSVFYKQLIPLLFSFCKLFSYNSKPIHALLAS